VDEKEVTYALIPTSQSARLVIAAKTLAWRLEHKEEVLEDWLCKVLPELRMDDVRKYVLHFINEGFDSVTKFQEIELEDLDFMKTSHKRALLRVLRLEHKEGRIRKLLRFATAWYKQ
jgi:hypothetical protein